MNKTLQKSYPGLADKIGLPCLWIKHEYLNEAGSHKIRLMQNLIENHLKKGDNLIITAFGGGFSWGAIYFKWSYN